MEGARIMLVEDEEIIASNLRDMLEYLGYVVPCISLSAEDAILKADLFYPDLVLMDVVLRGKRDGIEAADVIRERFNVPVIFLSAYSDEEILERAKKTEPYGYLSKPFKVEDLHNNIEIALHKHWKEQ